MVEKEHFVVFTLLLTPFLFTVLRGRGLFSLFFNLLSFHQHPVATETLTGK
jgi:hypothetical protein